MGGYPGRSGWAQCHHEGPYWRGEEVRAERRREDGGRGRGGKTLPAPKPEEGPGAEERRQLRSGDRPGSSFSPRRASPADALTWPRDTEL